MFFLGQTQEINLPLEDVFKFFEKPENLNVMTPDFLYFKMLEKSTDKMEIGSIFIYKIKLGIIPLKWKTVIVNYNKDHSFTDAQFKGPYRHWIHTHTFERVGNKTLMKDIVYYDLYGWFLKSIINKLFIKATLEKIFKYRFDKINEIFNKIK